MATTQLTKDEVAVRDTKAHLQSLLEELSVVTAQVDAIHSQKCAAEAEYDALTEDIATAKTELASVLKKKSDAERAVIRSHELHERTTKERREFEAYASRKEKELAEKGAAHYSDIAARKIVAAELEQYIESLHAEIASVNKLSLDSTQQLQGVRDAISAEEKAHHERVAAIETKLLATKEQLTLEEQMVIRAKAEAQAAKDAVGAPLKALRAEEEKLAARLRNYRIYRARLIKYYGNVFPGLNLDI